MAPRRLRMFKCDPTWMSILSSDINARSCSRSPMSIHSARHHQQFIIWFLFSFHLSRSHHLLLCASQTNSIPTAWASNFHRILLNILHFLVKHFGDLLHTNFCHHQSLFKIFWNWTDVYVHSVLYQLYTDLKVFEYNIFNSTTAFFADCFGQDMTWWHDMCRFWMHSKTDKEPA